MIDLKTPPTWFYKAVAVENLKPIQREILTKIFLKFPDLASNSPNFLKIFPDEMINDCPCYVEFIKKFGDFDKWSECAVITTQNNIDFPIHVDSYDWFDLCYGLNIPILNCHNSHIVWYEAEIEIDLDKTDKFYQRDTARRQRKHTIAREIARCDMNLPAWINTSIPHRPVSTHGKLQIIFSARFNPELHELLYE